MGMLDEEIWHANNRNRGSSRLILALSDTQLIGGVFGGLCTLAAAFITGALQGHVVGLGPGGAAHPAPTVTITRTAVRTVTASPSASTSATPAQAASQPSPSQESSTASILKPIITQPGWALEWHRDVSIGPQGVILSNSGARPSNGSNYDLQYLPGNGNGWNNNVSYSDYWSHQFKFGPANIVGIIGGSGEYDNVAGTQASVGDRLWTASTGDNGIDRITYMQVIGVGAENVVVDMWVWQPA
jgi:hypothetical protein